MKIKTKLLLAFSSILLGLILYILIEDNKVFLFSLTFGATGVGMLFDMMDKPKALKYTLKVIFAVLFLYLGFTFDKSLSEFKDKILTEITILENKSLNN